MKKTLLCFSCILLLLVFVVNLNMVEAKRYKGSIYPSIPMEEFVLGGIRINDSAEKVKKMYGEPTKIYNEYIPSEDLYCKVYCYGDTLKIHITNMMNHEPEVYRVTTTSNNGIVPKSGISVGEKCLVVLAYYGDDNVNEIVNNFVSYNDVNGEYHVQKREVVKLCYKIRNGVITEICLTQYVG